MADEDDHRDWRPRGHADQRLFDRAVADALARQIDRENPLPTDDRIRQLAKDEAQKLLDKMPNYEETRRVAREETTRILDLIGLDTSDKEIANTGARLRAALTFPASAWSFVKWLGGAFIVALLGAIGTLASALFGGHR